MQNTRNVVLKHLAKHMTLFFPSKIFFNMYAFSVSLKSYSGSLTICTMARILNLEENWKGGRESELREGCMLSKWVCVCE